MLGVLVFGTEVIIAIFQSFGIFPVAMAVRNIVFSGSTKYDPIFRLKGKKIVFAQRNRKFHKQNGWLLCQVSSLTNL